MCTLELRLVQSPTLSFFTSASAFAAAATPPLELLVGLAVAATPPLELLVGLFLEEDVAAEAGAAGADAAAVVAGSVSLNFFFVGEGTTLVGLPNAASALAAEAAVAACFPLSVSVFLLTEDFTGDDTFPAAEDFTGDDNRGDGDGDEGGSTLVSTLPTAFTSASERLRGLEGDAAAAAAGDFIGAGESATVLASSNVSSPPPASATASLLFASSSSRGDSTSFTVSSDIPDAWLMRERRGSAFSDPAVAVQVACESKF
jgi:hypothetical protein